MASAGKQSVVISFDQESRRLLNRIASALEEANQLTRELNRPTTVIAAYPQCMVCGAKTTHTHKMKCPNNPN